MEREEIMKGTVGWQRRHLQRKINALVAPLPARWRLAHRILTALAGWRAR